MGDIMSRPEAWKLVQSVLSKGMFGQDSEVSEGGDAAKEAISDEMNAAMLQYMPLRGPVSFGGGVSMADVQKLVDRLNAMEK
jgi:beta-glucosidase